MTRWRLCKCHERRRLCAGAEDHGRRSRRTGQHATHFNLRIRSAGLMTSVRRIPNFSLTTTTSPCATSVPLTNTSSGSPAARSSSTTDPWLSCNRLRIGMRVRPTSIDRVTETSRITSKLTSRPLGWPSSWRSSNCAVRGSAALAFIGYSSGSLGDQAFSRRVVTAHALLDLHGLQAVRQAEAAAEHRHVLGEDRDLALEIARHDVSGLQIQEGGQRDVAVTEARRELHFGVFDFLAQADHPTLVLLDAVAGDTGIENLAQRLDHGVGHRHVQVAATPIDFDVVTGDDDDLGRRDD